MDYEEFRTLVPRFAGREAGGRELAKSLASLRQKPNAVVLALPRGGVVTASVVARELDLPFDVLIVRKLGVPGHAELAMGAIGGDGVRILNWDVIASLRIPPEEIERVAREEEIELERRDRLFRGGLGPLDLRHKDVILVDDGIATGATMEAAIAVARRAGAARVVAAAPIGTVETCRRLRLQTDELVVLETPEPFFAVGYWYEDFPQVEDNEVKQILIEAQSVAAL